MKENDKIMEKRNRLLAAAEALLDHARKEGNEVEEGVATRLVEAVMRSTPAMAAALVDRMLEAKRMGERL